LPDKTNIYTKICTELFDDTNDKFNPPIQNILNKTLNVCKNDMGNISKNVVYCGGVSNAANFDSKLNTLCNLQTNEIKDKNKSEKEKE